jgi:hypothetical protein
VTAGALTNVLRYRLLFVLLLAASAASAREFSGFLAAEIRFFTESHGFPEQHGSIWSPILSSPWLWCGGVRLVCQFLELTDLSAFVAASYGVQQRLNVALEEAVMAYASVQRRSWLPA